MRVVFLFKKKFKIFFILRSAVPLLWADAALNLTLIPMHRTVPLGRYLSASLYLLTTSTKSDLTGSGLKGKTMEPNKNSSKLVLKDKF